MEYCKLQIGCILIVLYMTIIYYRNKSRIKREARTILYEALLVTGVIALLFDASTAYTVNKIEYVDPLLNTILHCGFLIGIDTLIFLMALYVMETTRGLPSNDKYMALLCLPFFLNITVVIVNMDSLEYRVGEYTNYSMGVSAYTCFVMAGVYMLVALLICIRRYKYIESRRRIAVFTGLAVVIGVTAYQMLVPEALLTSIAITMVIIAAYVNQEDPVIAEIAKYRNEMVMGFATLVESRDDSTGHHIMRSTMYAKLLAQELVKRGFYTNILTRDYVRDLDLAAPMHDVGKIAIPDSILKKPGKLTEEEFEIMKTHAEKGGEIVKNTFGHLEHPQFLLLAYDIARHHHEKWDGTGYPDGFKGNKIPLCARIMAIADVFDAVSEDRCYRPAMPLEQCFAIIEEGVGSSFDPLMARTFLDIKEKVIEVYNGKVDD